MDLELQKIYSSLEKYSSVDGIEEIRKDMETLDNKLAEYKGMSRLNSYNVPTVIIEMDKLNNNIEQKYDDYFKKFKSNSYSINVFGAGNDSFEQKIESSLSTLGKAAVSKICKYHGVNVLDCELNTSNYELAKIYNTNVTSKVSFESQDNDILDTKMSFKVLY